MEAITASHDIDLSADCYCHRSNSCSSHRRKCLPPPGYRAEVLDRGKTLCAAIKTAECIQNTVIRNYGTTFTSFAERCHRLPEAAHRVEALHTSQSFTRIVCSADSIQLCREECRMLCKK
jgi:hypothetical protein